LVVWTGLGQTERRSNPCALISSKAYKNGYSNWYHHALNAFCRTTALAIKSKKPLVIAYTPTYTAKTTNTDLLKEAHIYHEALLKQMEEGRNRLTRNEFLVAQNKRGDLIDQINHQADPKGLHNYIEQVTHAFNIYAECMDDDPEKAAWFLRPSTDMMLEALPGIEEKARWLMLDRRQASQRENVAFATWEHPLITMLMDEVQGFDSGKLTSAYFANCSAPRRHCIGRSMFVIEATAHPLLETYPIIYL